MKRAILYAIIPSICLVILAFVLKSCNTEEISTSDSYYTVEYEEVKGLLIENDYVDFLNYANSYLQDVPIEVEILNNDSNYFYVKILYKNHFAIFSKYGDKVGGNIYSNNEGLIDSWIGKN